MDNIIELHSYIKRFGYENINFYSDSSLDLFSIVAVHSTKNGPAIGGCRCIEYEDINAALEDALKLSKAMSYKSSIHNLPHGGAKAVILKPKKINNRRYYTAEQVELLKMIKFLLKSKGMTISGVKKILELNTNKLDDHNTDSLKADYYKNYLKVKSKNLLNRINKIKSYGKKNTS